MGRKKQKMSDKKMMDLLATLLIEDAIENNDDGAIDMLEQCLVPVGIPPIPWRGIVAQGRQKKSKGEDPASIIEQRGYNLRFLPMVI